MTLRAKAGRYGCTVDVIPMSGGQVMLEVVERVIAELRAWAEERNEERRARADGRLSGLRGRAGSV